MQLPIYLIDDDPLVRISIAEILDTRALHLTAFESAEALLADFADLAPGVLIIDLQLEGKDGLTLLADLRNTGCRWPAVMITGHGGVRAAVRAMRLDAVEFLEKPFDPTELLEAIARGCSIWAEDAERHAVAERARERIGALSPREREVMEGMLSGWTSKELALELGLSYRTVEMHRSRMMKRLGARGQKDVFDIAYLAGIARTRPVRSDGLPTADPLPSEKLDRGQ